MLGEGDGLPLRARIAITMANGSTATTSFRSSLLTLCPFRRCYLPPPVALDVNWRTIIEKKGSHRRQGIREGTAEIKQSNNALDR